MVKKLFSALFIFFSLTNFAQQVQNPGFESWTNTFPSNWGTNGLAIYNASGINPGSETQTATKHTGNFAVLLQNQFVSVAGTYIPGGVCTGPVTLPGGIPTYGFAAYSSQPVSYNFWYWFTQVSGDSAGTSLYLTKWNTGMNKRDTLAIGGKYIVFPTFVYTQTIVPITWLTTGTTPDSIQLYIGSSVKLPYGNPQPPAGGKMYLDDVSFTLPIGIQKINEEGEFVTVYPNPAASTLNISTNGLKANNASIYDLSGNVVAKHELNGRITQVDISSLPEGIYLYLVRDEVTGKIFSSKFSVNK